MGLQPSQHLLQAGPHRIDVPAGDAHRRECGLGRLLAFRVRRMCHASRTRQRLQRGLDRCSGSGLPGGPCQTTSTSLAPETNVFDRGGGGTSRQGGSLLDSTTNRLDEQLRRSAAMDDATDPGDAIDAALRQLDSQSAALALLRLW